MLRVAHTVLWSHLTCSAVCAVLLQVVPGSRHLVFAAAGALRSVDPDRLVIKKIVLSGAHWFTAFWKSRCRW